MKNPDTSASPVNPRVPPRWIGLTIVLVILGIAFGFYLASKDSEREPDGRPPTPAVSLPSTTGDHELADLFQRQQSDVQVTGSGRVTRILADDNEGSRHQKFIVELASGQTLLIAHNIDLAPRLNGLKVGDEVSFFGEYVYSEQGGTIHWTHHDPARKHVSGWLEWKGRTYG